MPHTFLDAHGIERAIEINPITLDRTFQRFEVRLMDLVNANLTIRLATNGPLLMNILAELALPGVPDQEAVQLLGRGDVLESAVDALLSSVVDYLPERFRVFLIRHAKRHWP